MLTERQYLAGLTRAELEHILKKHEFQSFRAQQILKWVYENNVYDFAEMSDLPKYTREKLSKIFTIIAIKPIKELVSPKDKTTKVLFETEDHETFESVFLFDKDRTTLCISSQVGCKLGCRFCATGLSGFVRNLSVAEIVSEFLYFSKLNKVDNIVFMGMGEPLDNYSNVIKAISIICKEANFAQRRITVSTAGLVPQIKKLAKAKMQITLAVSLNSASDNIRRSLMPIARRYTVEEIIASLHEYTMETSRRVSIEYVLLAGVNDSEKDAKALVRVLKDLRCNINLIQYNSVGTETFTSPPGSQMKQFQFWLERDGKEVSLRYKRGQDINAACGQLRRTEKDITDEQAI